MIISRHDIGFQFICKHCHQYANNPRVCLRCETIYCYDCLAQEPREYDYHLYTYQCICNINNSKELDIVQQYVTRQLKIKCRICDEIKSILKIKRHEAKCHQKYQESFNYSYLGPKFKIKYFNCQIKILSCMYCKQIELEQFYLISLENQQIICKKCIQLQFFNHKYQIQMSEEQLGGLKSLLFQCEYCLQQFNYYEILNHNFVCLQQFIDCKCGWQGRRYEFLNHFELCAIEELKNLKIQLKQINLLKQVVQFQFQNQEDEFNQFYSERNNIVFDMIDQSEYPDFTRDINENASDDEVYD
ncbi:hypothetical protein pb186bvf_011210 [Paramecium bursaria]